MELTQSISKELLNAATHINGYSPMIAWSNSIGWKPNIVKYAERHRSALLAEEFLVNSYYDRNDSETESSLRIFSEEAGVVVQSLMQKRDFIDCPNINLPDSISLDMSLGESILKRRSVREFTGDAIPLSYLATVARVAKGYTETAQMCLRDGSEITLNFSTVASGGHLYPIELYFVVLNVKGLASGIYCYSEHEDLLFKLHDENKVKEILASLSTPDFSSIRRANYFCLFAAQPWKSMCKYGNRGLRFVLQEIGAMTQNIHLANVCLGLGSIDWGGYYENETNSALNFDGVTQSILHMLLAGITG